jgi:hypothetical protein
MERSNLNLTGGTSRHYSGMYLEALRKAQGASGRKSQGLAVI